MKSLKILLVEDSPSDVRLIREALKETPVPVQIAVARDGVEAMEQLHRTEVGTATRPDLILLDLNLPRKKWPGGSGRDQSIAPAKANSGTSDD